MLMTKIVVTVVGLLLIAFAIDMVIDVDKPERRYERDFVAAGATLVAGAGVMLLLAVAGLVLNAPRRGPGMHDRWRVALLLLLPDDCARVRDREVTEKRGE